MSIWGKATLLLNPVLWGGVLRSFVLPASILRGAIQVLAMLVVVCVVSPTATRQFAAHVLGYSVPGMVSGRYSHEGRHNLEVQFLEHGRSLRADILISQATFETSRENTTVRLRVLPVLRWVALEGDVTLGLSITNVFIAGVLAVVGLNILSMFMGKR